MLLLAGLIGAAMAGGLYLGVQSERAQPPHSEPPQTLVALSPAPESEALQPAESVDTIPDSEVEDRMLQGVEMPELAELERLDQIEWLNELDRLNAIAESDTDDIVLDGGVRIGLLEPIGSDEELSPTEPEQSATPRVRRRTRPRRPPGPRLHSDPGRHTLMTARQMIASDERIQGSCYRYLSEVFERAGHDGWRKRTIVYRAGREGPYADLDLIRPGDWLYIVNDPSRTPVGTHSVLFVGWEDRARGYARTISHAGWGIPRAGRERGYDVSQTYRIIRPTL